MKRVQPETKKVMKEMKAKGISLEGIGKILGFSASTIQYHLSDDSKKKAITRATKNRKPWAGLKEYNRKYQSERYNNDPEFRERVKKANRENWRKKHGKSNNLS